LLAFKNWLNVNLEHWYHLGKTLLDSRGALFSGACGGAVCPKMDRKYNLGP
jgi:hypothetical protein